MIPPNTVGNCWKHLPPRRRARVPTSNGAVKCEQTDPTAQRSAPGKDPIAMDDEDAAGLDALQHLTGAEFESGDVHERRGCNEPAPGVEAEDGREEWAGGRQNYANESGRRRRLADTRASTSRCKIRGVARACSPFRQERERHREQAVGGLRYHRGEVKQLDGVHLHRLRRPVAICLLHIGRCTSVSCRFRRTTKDACADY